MPRPTPEVSAALALQHQRGPLDWPTVADAGAPAGLPGRLEARMGLFAAAAIEQAEADAGGWRRRGLRAVYVDEPGFPRRSRSVGTAPAILFLRGALASPDHDAVAVVGTRTPSREGAGLATTVAAGLAGAGVTVLSGLARGVDTIALETAHATGGRTVAVLGCGLDHVYPPENARLQDRIDVLVSPFRPEIPPTADGFRRRNEIIASISRAMVVIEAGGRSGARIAVRHALAAGRSVLLLPPVLEQEWARARLGDPAVIPVSGPGEVLEVLARCSS